MARHTTRLSVGRRIPVDHATSRQGWRAPRMPIKGPRQGLGQMDHQQKIAAGVPK